jgi:hypothetical protein
MNDLNSTSKTQGMGLASELMLLQVFKLYTMTLQLIGRRSHQKNHQEVSLSQIGHDHAATMHHVSAALNEIVLY